MFDTIGGRSWSFGVSVGLAAILAQVGTALAYINGGDFHSTLKTFEKQLKKDGWSVSFANPVSNGVARPDQPDNRQFVNQLVGRALKALPEKEAESLSAEAKREVVRLARGTIAKAISNKKQIIQEGQLGSLRYQVGAYAFESYWETNYGGKREIHERRSGLVPFVALKMEGASGDKSKP